MGRNTRGCTAWYGVAYVFGFVKFKQILSFTLCDQAQVRGQVIVASTTN